MTVRFGGNWRQSATMYYNYNLQSLLHPYIMRRRGGKKKMMMSGKGLTAYVQHSIYMERSREG